MSKSLDRLTLLETFARIAERGSISAAARDLGMSQASASRQLKELEERLGAELIRRTTHALALTPAGQDCLAEARGLIAAWDSLVERFAEDSGGLRGGLKVVAPVALGQLYLADAALRFQQAHPAVGVTWLLEDAAIRFAEIGCDLWIKIGPVPDDSLVVRPLGKVERMIVAAPELMGGKRIAGPSDLAALPCAALEPFEAGTIPLSTARGRQATVAARVALATNNIFAVHKAALLGIGYAVLPRWFVERELETGALVDVLPDWRAPALTIHAAYLPARRQRRRLAAFLDHMAEAVSAIPGVRTA
ncbi:LysR family transcriptional regulator [Pelagibius sp.]|uniref:LysR family transcriptional regulator n=1 Tax=Pelagibius sp. TaxID=1931238 RepID=UPI0026322DD8|nr:LysR family transcriptional regulator [Pelagibius sp.]